MRVIDVLLVAASMCAASQVSAFQIVDSGGRVVGEVAGVTPAIVNTIVVLRRTESGTLVSLGAERDRISGTGSGENEPPGLLYETTGCSGTGFIEVAEVVRKTYVVQDPGTAQALTAYYAADPIQTRTMRSQTRLGGQCTGDCGTPGADGFCCCPLADEQHDAGAAATMDLAVFTAPFIAQ